MRLITIYIDTLDEEVYNASRHEDITVCEAMRIIAANPNEDWIAERKGECRSVDCIHYDCPSIELYNWMSWK